MTTYNGYTKDLSPEEKLKNEIETVKKFLQDNPNNEYWRNRLTALTCSCFLYMGDNSECPVHGKKTGAVAESITLDDDYVMAQLKADYEERKELYAMGMGY